MRNLSDLAFKEDVIKMIAAGRPVSELSIALGVSGSLLRRWYKASQFTSSNSNQKGTKSFTFDHSLEEIERLKTELRRTEQERDILKKALGIFSRGI
ncbi:MAG: transposase [Chitinophagaceae bacterium]